jgi:beta-lactamase class A
VRADEARPAASLLKVPLVAALYAAAAAGEIELQSEVRRSELPTSTYPSVLAAFGDDHRFQLRELCKLALITSDNSVADHLLSVVGRRRVNDWLVGEDCQKTVLRVGFSDEELGNSGRRNESTAEESLSMLHLVSSHATYAELGCALENNLRNTRIPLRLPDETPVRHKTGTLLNVVNDVGVILGLHLDLGVAVLSDSEADSAEAGLEIGNMVAKIWAALGESVAW